MFVSACRERPLCTMFTFFFFFSPQILTHSVPLNGPKEPCKLRDPPCPSLFKDINTLLAATLIAAIPPFSFFCLNTCVCVFCLCICLCIAWKSCVFCGFMCFYGDSLSACAWPQRHFMRLSHSTVLHHRCAASSFSGASGGQRGLVHGVTSAYRVRWPHCLGWVVTGASSFIHLMK